MTKRPTQYPISSQACRGQTGLVHAVSVTEIGKEGVGVEHIGGGVTPHPHLEGQGNPPDKGTQGGGGQSQEEMGGGRRERAADETGRK